MPFSDMWWYRQHAQLGFRRAGFDAVSYEIGDRPIFEDFLGGIGIPSAFGYRPKIK